MEQSGSFTGAMSGESMRAWKDSAQCAAERATGYVQEQLHRADSKVNEITGRPLASWTGDAQKFVRDHPVQSAAVVLGLGYVLGKLMLRD
jgi:ElaB/YqjD/DUF883 family membrane-anchored ribosome-binding protein